MLNEIGTPDRVGEFVKRAQDPDDNFRLMGFGHRVYKNFDPRAKILKAACDEVLADLGVEDPRLEIAMKLEKIALEDDYFIQRKLYPNVDFYSGIILSAMGFPHLDVHRVVRPGADSGMIFPMEGDDGGSRAAHQPPAPALHIGPAQREFVGLDQR